MATALMLPFCFVLLASLVAAQQQASCVLRHSFGGQARIFKTCQPLAAQGAQLAWTHFPSNRTLEVAFTSTAPSASGWIGWGVNLSPKPGMIGADVLIAFRNSSGSGGAIVESYHLTASNLGSLQPAPMSSVKLVSKAVSVQGSSSRMSIFAIIQLPASSNNASALNHLWNRGAAMNGLQPLPHSSADVNSLGSIDLNKGTLAAASAPHQMLKNRHAIMNTVGWGVLLPLGVMSARYLRSFESADPAWFYIHAVCQSSGYILGVVGWATGIKLGSYTTAKHSTHRNLGIAIFAFSTLQVLSLLLRPKKEHKVRKYWNVYHHAIGYSAIAMILANIFEGFDILRPAAKWRRAYVGVIASVGAASLVLEVVTWLLYLQRRRRQQPLGKDFAAAPPTGAALGLPHGHQAWGGTPAAA